MASPILVLLCCFVFLYGCEARCELLDKHDTANLDDATRKELERIKEYIEHHKAEYHDLAPTGNENGVVNVNVRMDFERIDGLDLEHHVLDSVAHLHIDWVDDRLKWNYHNHLLHKMVLPAYDVWEPDLHVINDDAADGHHTLMDDDPRVVVGEDGHVCAVWPLHMHTTCDNLKSAYTQGEKAVCEIVIGSWTYDEGRLDLTDEGVYDHTKEHENNHWHVENITHVVEHEEFEGDKTSHADIRYTLTLVYHD